MSSSREHAARRSGPRRLRGALAALLVLVAAPPIRAAAAPVTASVVVTVDDQQPVAPRLTGKAETLTVSLTVRNTGTTALQDLSLQAVRQAPITTVAQLSGQLQAPQQSGAAFAVVLPDQPVAGTVAGGASVRVTYTVPVGPNDDATLCLCQDGGAYPLRIAVDGEQAGDPDGTGPTELGSTYTYVPTFFGDRAVTPVQVAWVWPLVDRPHRATEGSVFTDDVLADEITAGGRLDRALAVVEDVAPTVRLSLVLDPELIDELVAMTGGYQVTGGSRTVAGTGAQAAAAWLARLRRVLPRVDVSVTSIADVDAESAVPAGAASLVRPLSADPAMAARVERALGTTRVGSGLDWPAGGTLSGAVAGLREQQGVRTFLLPAPAVTGSAQANADGTVPDALAALRGQPAGVDAAITDGTQQQLVASAISIGGQGAAVLPELSAELAVRGAAVGARSYLDVLAPPRWVDPDVPAAVRTITTTTRADWTAPASVAQLRTAAAADAPLDLAAEAPAPTVSVPAANIAAGQAATATADDAAAMISYRAPGATAPASSGPATPTPSASASRAPTGTAPAVSAQAGAAGLRTDAEQTAVRLASVGWTTDPAAAGRARAAADAQAGRLGSAVAIVQPTRGYSLTSSDSPLLLTLRNDLDWPASVRVSVTGGPLGFTTTDPGVQQVPAHGVLPLSIKTHIERSGRFQLTAGLTTPDYRTVGTPITVAVSSSALGAVGVIITAVALAVLVVALLLRVTLRIRRSRRAAA